ncbi:hypothetical protein E2C01_067976 [Portunus trituberculatus]|uniref:Uncharacterized protein n=1 Tax=Portunus trituberculatus TaxID=210409 RepID=A0A5B7HMI8_PORTR|nr:hypothetical protein [Portunus trituberculatus]
MATLLGGKPLTLSQSHFPVAKRGRLWGGSQDTDAVPDLLKGGGVRHGPHLGVVVTGHSPRVKEDNSSMGIFGRLWAHTATIRDEPLPRERVFPSRMYFPKAESWRTRDTLAGLAKRHPPSVPRSRNEALTYLSGAWG